jgi:hypothetical protein
MRAIYFNSFDNSVSKFNMSELTIIKDSLLFFAFKTLTGLQTAAVALLYKADTVMTLFKVLDAGHFISAYISYMNRSIIR